MQLPMPVYFDGIFLCTPYRLDLLVEKKLVVELKAAVSIDNLHLAQLNSYLRLGNYHLGLLLNFGAPLMKDGMKRVVNSRYIPPTGVG